MIALGSDHGGYELKEAIKAYFTKKNIRFIDYGTDSSEPVDYPVFAKKVCKAVQSGEYGFGILFCGTGIGMSIVANKHKNIRAAVVSDELSAEMCRRHNNANVLCLGGRIIDSKKAIELVEIFLSNSFDGGRHEKRVDMYE